MTLITVPSPKWTIKWDGGTVISVTTKPLNIQSSQNINASKNMKNKNHQQMMEYIK